jgi:hypothetical protein
MRWWRKLFGKTKFPGVDYQVKYAFTVGGVDYYEMDDLMNQPFERAVTCLTFYGEFNQRVDRDYLAKFIEGMKKALEMVPGQPVKIPDAVNLVRNLEDRLSFIIDADLAYKLASVVYFDKSENSAVYDFKYNQRKIDFWKKEATAKEFFFMQPLQKLIPFLKDFEANFDTYLMVTEAVKGQHLKNISQLLSKN